MIPDEDENLFVTNNQSSASIVNTHNADVQTDDLEPFSMYNDYEEYSITHLIKQLMYGIRRKILQSTPTQTQIIRILFLTTAILFIVQIGMYIRFLTLNQRLLHAQQLLMKALEQKAQEKNYSFTGSNLFFNDNPNNNSIISDSLLGGNVAGSAGGGGGGGGGGSDGTASVTSSSSTSYCFLNSGANC